MKTIFKRIIFYILSFTWGGITSWIGLLVILFSLPFGRVFTYHGRLYAIWGSDWGGCELGCFFICGRFSKEHTLMHECGHGLQNCIWGPLFPIVIALPSAIRYWYRRLKRKHNPQVILPKYDSIWFEGQATRWGEKYVQTDQI